MINYKNNVQHGQLVVKPLGTHIIEEVKNFHHSNDEIRTFSRNNHLGNTNQYTFSKYAGYIHIVKKNQFGQSMITLLRVCNNTGKLISLENEFIDLKCFWVLLYN